MSTPISSEVEAVGVVVSDDRMSAAQTVDTLTAPHGVDLASARLALDAAGVPVSDEALRALAGEGGRITARRTLVARGVGPRPGTPATLEVVAPLVPLAARGAVATVREGEVVARVRPGLPGAPGHDVTGSTIPCGTPRPDFELGRGVRLDASGQVLARAEGRAALVGGRVITVFPLIDLVGDVAAHDEPTEVEVDLRVPGSVREYVSVVAGGSLAVAGSAEASRLEAGEDLFVGGGMLGHDRGEFVAGRDVACRFAAGARITAGHDVRVDGDLLHCRVVCGGRLVVAERVQGCDIVATGGARLRNVTNSNRSDTVIEAGTTPALRALALERLPAVEEHIGRLAHARATLATLAQRRAQLTPAQRQQALKLFGAVAVTERELEALAADLRTGWAAHEAAAVAEIAVDDGLAEGVVVRFPGMTATIAQALRGPLLLRPGTDDGEPHVLAIDARSGTATRLPARFVADPLAGQLKRVISRLD